MSEVRSILKHVRPPILFLVLLRPATLLNGAAYDPLAVDPGFKPRAVELNVHDDSRSRDVPVRIYLPPQSSPAPVVLFSHGLGGSRKGNAFLGEHWAARGYVAVFIQHPGSDTSVWHDKPAGKQLNAMRDAMSLENFMDRVGDVHAVLNMLASWNTDKKSELHNRLDLQEVGMSGHSFGAITTEAVSGEHFPISGTSLTDDRIKAAVAFSPSPPRREDPEKAFASVKIPWLLMTGTRDVVPALGGADMKSRLAVYPALHGAPKYQVILNNAEHSAFTDRALPGDHEPRNPNHHRVMLALTTAFWDAYIKHDEGALTWINGAGPRTVLEAEDDWKFSPK